MLKTYKKGFTIVELLIVIVVIGILAALVLNTFQGVQARARDTERRTDINAIHTQVEVWYNDNNSVYPANAAALTVANLPGIDAEALLDPNNAAVGAGDYTYTAAPAGCDNGVGGDCTSYQLWAQLEGDEDGDGVDGEVGVAQDAYVKNSLNI